MLFIDADGAIGFAGELEVFVKRLIIVCHGVLLSGL
jgi:hypothetical protein